MRGDLYIGYYPFVFVILEVLIVVVRITMKLEAFIFSVTWALAVITEWPSPVGVWKVSIEGIIGSEVIVSKIVGIS